MANLSWPLWIINSALLFMRSSLDLPAWMASNSVDFAFAILTESTGSCGLADAIGSYFAVIRNECQPSFTVSHEVSECMNR